MDTGEVDRGKDEREGWIVIERKREGDRERRPAVKKTRNYASIETKPERVGKMNYNTNRRTW